MLTESATVANALAFLTALCMLLMLAIDLVKDIVVVKEKSMTPEIDQPGDNDDSVPRSTSFHEMRTPNSLLTCPRTYCNVYTFPVVVQA